MGEASKAHLTTETSPPSSESVVSPLGLNRDGVFSGKILPPLAYTAEDLGSEPCGRWVMRPSLC